MSKVLEDEFKKIYEKLLNNTAFIFHSNCNYSNINSKNYIKTCMRQKNIKIAFINYTNFRLNFNIISVQTSMSLFQKIIK